MGKKKSKCCCVYRKPLQFGESSSETDDECENCFGHVEVKKAHRKKKKKGPDNGNNDSHDEDDHGCNHNHPKDPQPSSSNNN